MSLQNVYIPYGGYWSSPFSRWQGSFSSLHPIRFVADVATRALLERGLSTERIDSLSLGMTVPAHHAMYATPWLAGLLGLEGVTGPLISQACATSVRSIALAASEVETGHAQLYLAVTADKTSNGPHIYYPAPDAPGGTGATEDWVVDGFNFDPHARNSMVQTAENVAAEAGIDRSEQEELTLLRYSQYQQSQADGRAFASRYMVAPIEVKDARGRKVLATVEADEGVFPTTAEGLATLRPVVEGGTVTYGTQTHPADGNAGMLLTGRRMAAELSAEPNVEIQLVSYGQARAPAGMMPTANVPAVELALDRAGIGVHDLRAITTHTPFAVNDIYLSRQLGLDLEKMNRFGCSLIWGHPQAPTGMRSVIELIEELVLLGGGYGLFTGCAAGDSAAALVLRVDVT